MAVAPNTSHPLYPYLTALICVDTDGNTIIDVKGGQTLTPHANVTRGTTGTYGRYFRTLLNAGNAEGVAMSPGIKTKPLSGTGQDVGTTFVVINAGNSRSGRGSVFNNATSSASVGPAVTSGDVACMTSNTASASGLGTTDILGTGAHSFAVGVNGTTQGKTWVDGALENTYTTGLGNSSDTALATYLGGNTSGGYGGFAADYVWIAQFSRYLTDAEVADLHASLGADNQFGLVVGLTPVSADFSASYGISANVNADFSAAFSINSDVYADFNATFTVQDGSLVWADFAAAYSLMGTVSADFSASYSVGTAVSADFSASYNVASAGIFVSDVWINNADTPWPSGTPIAWTWVQGGTPGDIIGKTMVKGAGALTAQNRASLAGCPSGAGLLLAEVVGSSPRAVYYEEGVVV